jgi:Protein of unknown function (DUF2281)
MTDQLILAQIKMMPDALKKEVLDFIGYLISKHNLPVEKSKTSIAEHNPPVQSKMPGQGKSRQFGCGKGIFKYVAPDFDDTPTGFEEYMPADNQ